MCDWVMDSWAQAAHMLRTTAHLTKQFVRAEVTDSALSNFRLLETVGQDVLCHQSRESKVEMNYFGRFSDNSYFRRLSFGFSCYASTSGSNDRAVCASWDRAPLIRDVSGMELFWPVVVGIGKMPTDLATSVEPICLMTGKFVTAPAALHRSIDG
jgi:hypothetical protein